MSEPSTPPIVGTGPVRVDQADAPASQWHDRLAVRAVAVFLGSRVVCLVAIAVAAHHKGVSFGSATSVFDGAYYRQIALHWYPHRLATGPPGVLAPSPLAFFPLYPTLLGALRVIGIPLTVGALLIDTCCGAAAAALIAITVSEWTTPKAALLTAALWCVYPLAVVLSLTYTEALFTLLLAGALLAFARDRTVLAAGCTALACLTRPSGVVIVVVFVIVALKDRSVAALKVAAGGAVAVFAWMAYLAARTGTATAWFTTEKRGWNVYYDGGVNSTSRAVHYLLHPGQRPAAAAEALLLIGMVVLLVAAWWQPMPRYYSLLSCLLFVEAAGSHNAYSSIPRFMLPAFPMLLPLAAWLLRLPRIVMYVVVLIGLAAMAVGGVYLSLYSTYPP